LNFCNQLHWYLQPGSLAGALGRHGMASQSPMSAKHW
jgi:hypothetical protein